MSKVPLRPLGSFSNILSPDSKQQEAQQSDGAKITKQAGGGFGVVVHHLYGFLRGQQGIDNEAGGQCTEGSGQQINQGGARAQCTPNRR